MIESLVCFPFKKEDTEVFIKNIKEALSHPGVKEVLCVGYEENECYNDVKKAIPSIEKNTKKGIKLIIQKRLGNKRNGKGDGMNTALDFFINKTSYDRLHFYDADILTFDKEWISKSEEGMDKGYQVARCFFPRVSTDAMITWNITKCGFSYTWPNTLLPVIGQPLGGELAIDREVAEKLIRDKWVLNYSDWAIDTAYTISFCKHKFPIYELYIEKGKLHKLYGKLTDLYTMLIECFTIIQECQGMQIDTEGMKYTQDSVGKVPKHIKEKRGFDVDGTIPLLMENWSDKEIELLDFFPDNIKEGMLACRKKLDVSFMDPENWYEVYRVLLRSFNVNEKAWKDMLFRLWVARVLNHTLHYASQGYDYAIKSLADMIKFFREK